MPWHAGGPTPRQRQRLLGALELARRAVLEGRVAMPLDEPSALVAWFRDLAMTTTPQLGLAGLDGAGRLLVEQRLSGALHWRGPGTVLRPVLAAGAATLSIVAALPPGAPLLRHDDVAFARRLAQASALCEVRLADIVLLGDGRWLSLRQMGHLDAGAAT
jgi:DNA repair protein RadC